MEGYWGGKGERMEGKVQGIRSILDRHNTVGVRLRIVYETEAKNLYVQPMDMN